MDTAGDPPLQEDFRRRALVAGAGVIILGIVVLLLARGDAPIVYRGLTAPRSWPLILAAAVCAAVALALLTGRRFTWARAVAIAEVGLVVTGWGAVQYPYLVVPDVTIESAKAAPLTLTLLVWVLAAGVLLLFPAFGYLYRIFKTRPAVD